VSVDKFTLPPADSCCFCGISHSTIGGKRIVITKSGSIYWTLDMEYAESCLSDDFEIEKCRQGKTTISYFPCTSRRARNSGHFEVFLRLVGDVASEQAFKRALGNLQNGSSPWYCQCCAKRTCKICGSPFSYPGPCEALDDEGKILHVAIYPIKPGCTNPTCVNNYQAFLTRPESAAGVEYQFKWNTASSTEIREKGNHFTWNPASRSKFGDRLPVENIEKRKPLFWLASIGFEILGREIYMVNDSGETLDYAWSWVQGYFPGEDTEHAVAGGRFKYTTIKDHEAVKVEELESHDFDLRAGSLIIRTGSKNLGPLSFSVPFPYSFDNSAITNFSGRIASGLLWEGESFFRLKTLYIDMDNVLADFKSALNRLTKKELAKHKERYDQVPGFFSRMDPVAGAIEAFQSLCCKFDVYILSTAPWENPRAWMEKLTWVKEYLGEHAHKRLILSHHKNLNKGDFLIGNRTDNKAGEFDGELIQFGTEKFPDWQAVLDYLG
jgi:5'-nucleotidase